MRSVSRLALALVAVYLCVGLFRAHSWPEPVLENQQIIVVTAHPDDETMFFGPTLAYLVEPKRRNNVHFLVLSTGNAENLGSVRVGEMESAAELLGVSRTQVTVVDDERLQDGMQNEWDPRVIAQYVTNMVRDTNANTLITFDAYGVSNHPNHKAVFRGCVEASIPFAARKPFQLLSLHSVSILSKYLFAFDFSRYKRAEHVVWSNYKAYKLAKHALTHGHLSQMTWYRNIWTCTSRYMLVNELEKVDLATEARNRGYECADEIDAHNTLENRKTKAVQPPRTRPSAPTTYAFVTTYDFSGETTSQVSQQSHTWITRPVSRHINAMAHREL